MDYVEGKGLVDESNEVISFSPTLQKIEFII
nr:MAG TPA: hypothetical protein [Caudoviricetes sp.]